MKKFNTKFLYSAKSFHNAMENQVGYFMEVY